MEKKMTPQIAWELEITTHEPKETKRLKFDDYESVLDYVDNFGLCSAGIYLAVFADGALIEEL